MRIHRWPYRRRQCYGCIIWPVKPVCAVPCVSVYTQNAKRINVQNFYTHSQISLSIRQNNYFLVFRLLKQCHLNCTNYILLNGRITVNDQIGKKLRAHGPFQSLNCFWHNIMRNLEDTNCFQCNVSLQITTSNSVCFYHRLYMQVSFYARLRSWKMSRQSKLHKSNTKFPLKQYITWELGDGQPHPIQCITIPLVSITHQRMH